MAKQHIAGQDFDVLIGNQLVHVETMSASITDNRQAVQTCGIPDGYVGGDVACSGELELDAANFNIVMETARAAGSFHDMPAFDVICIAKTATSQQKFELFGCLFKLSDLMSIDSKGAEKSKNKLSFDVTDSDFVRINGIPYLSLNDTRDF